MTAEFMTKVLSESGSAGIVVLNSPPSKSGMHTFLPISILSDIVKTVNFRSPNILKPSAEIDTFQGLPWKLLHIEVQNSRGSLSQAILKFTPYK